MEWQPIETAPKDGTRILIYGSYQWKDYESWREVGIICAQWVQDDEDSSWQAISANPYTDYVQPTHWMPLPNPPEEK